MPARRPPTPPAPRVDAGRRLVLALALALVATGCGAFGGGTVEFSIGECVILPDVVEVVEYEAVDCAQVHDAEVFALPQHPAPVDAPYPGEVALDQMAEERCREAFEGYVGRPYDESVLYSTFLRPSQASWDLADDREIVCLLVGEPLDGADGSTNGYEQLSGSKRGIDQ